MTKETFLVIPAEAGIHCFALYLSQHESLALGGDWIPAFAGMTIGRQDCERRAE
jgi:hypothetical protein